MKKIKAIINWIVYISPYIPLIGMLLLMTLAMFAEEYEFQRDTIAEHGIHSIFTWIVQFAAIALASIYIAWTFYYFLTN